MNIVVIESPKTKNIFYPFSLKKETITNMSIKL